MSSSSDALEALASVYDEVAASEVIRPAAVLPEQSAKIVLMELSMHDVRTGGLWHATPTLWERYDRPWDGLISTQGDALLLGSMQVSYGTPTRYSITIYRATITTFGAAHEWTVQQLCDEALSFGGYSLESCPRADLTPPPRPFRMPRPRLDP